MTDAEIIAEAHPHSIMGRKLHDLLGAARTCEDVPGDVAELGVYKGGSGLLLARAFPRKAVRLFDTFNGIPEDDECPGGHKKDDFSDTSFVAVERLFVERSIYNAYLMPGRFWHIMPSLDSHCFAFVHLDADTYQSTKSGAEFFAPRLSPHGGLFFDDYTNRRTPGVKLVVDELIVSGQFDVTAGEETMFLKKRPCFNPPCSQ
jgi:O-methyltransferase